MKGQGGRPKLDDHERRSAVVRYRCRETEKTDLVEVAGGERQVSDYIRRAVDAYRANGDEKRQATAPALVPRTATIAARQVADELQALASSSRHKKKLQELADDLRVHVCGEQ